MKALAIVGPTASGKTALAIAVAQRIGGEIISCDSMQIYRGLDIGTAKPTPQEQAAVPHHLLDILTPDAVYSAAQYGEDAYTCACDIAARGRVPVFCGGTGLYLEAVRRARHDAELSGSATVRERLLAEAEMPGGPERLYGRLLQVDPVQAAACHPHNVRRVVRALEIYEWTGIPKSQWDARTNKTPPRVDFLTVGLWFSDRALLYERIDRRVDQMLAEGLVGEARRAETAGWLREQSTVAQAIGYKELVPYLHGEEPLEAATQRLKTATRRYAKRQLTWFSQTPGLVRIYADQEGRCLPTDRLADRVIAAWAEFCTC